MISGKAIISFILGLPKNSFVQMLFPLCLPLLYYMFFESEKSLNYIISKPEEVANKCIAFDQDSSFKKTFQTYISIYNIGGDIVDNVDFVNNRQIVFFASGDIDICDTKVIKKSRSTLALITRIDSITKTEFDIQLINNEVFEVNDFAVIRVIYKSSAYNRWVGKSRIKGIPAGIKEGALVKNESVIFYTTLTILIIIILIVLFRSVLFKIHNRSLVFRKVEIVIISTLLVFSTFVFVEYFRDYDIYEGLKHYL